MTNIPSVATYNQLVKNYDVRKEKFLNSKQVTAEVKHFEEAVKKLQTPEDIFKDRRLTKFLTSALNLAGEEKYPGKLRQALLGKVEDESAFINKTSDKRFKQAAEVLQLGERGLGRLKLGVVQDELITKYKEQQFDKSIGDQNPAVREALYFEKFAKNVDNVYDVLGDPVIRKVVTRTLGIPERIAFQPVETQAAVVEARINPSQLKDPQFREKFIKRFLNQSDLANNATNTGAGSYVTSLFSNRGGALNLFG